MNDAQLKYSLDLLDGKVVAIQRALVAVMRSHPHPEAAFEAVSSELEGLLSYGLQEDVSDAFLRGIESTRVAFGLQPPQEPSR